MLPGFSTQNTRNILIFYFFLCIQCIQCETIAARQSLKSKISRQSLGDDADAAVTEQAAQAVGQAAILAIENVECQVSQPLTRTAGHSAPDVFPAVQLAVNPQVAVTQLLGSHAHGPEHDMCCVIEREVGAGQSPFDV